MAETKNLGSFAALRMTGNSAVLAFLKPEILIPDSLIIW
jgi:hypothetical protein